MTTVFVSYSRDSAGHKAWVRKLSRSLTAEGLTVRLDQADLRPGADLSRYMETAVRESDFVLLVCTPGFAARADDRTGGVGYEQTIITGEILAGLGHADRFIPILRGPEKESIPSFLRSRVWVDFRDDSKFDEQVAAMATDLKSRTDSARTAEDAGERRASTSNDDLQTYSEAAAFARSKTGLGTTRAAADEFAQECQDTLSLEGLHLFIEVFEFANRTMKLSRAKARAFAEQWMDRDNLGEFEAYADLFKFATARGGMNLRPSGARDFVRDFAKTRGLADAPRFARAYQIARHSGKTRGEAEAFAFDQL